MNIMLDTFRQVGRTTSEISYVAASSDEVKASIAREAEQQAFELDPEGAGPSNLD